MKDETFQTYGFDQFIGRKICENGEVHVIDLDLNRLGEIGWNRSYDPEGLEFALKRLCLDISRKKRVLLRKSPGQLGLEEVRVPYAPDVRRNMSPFNKKVPVRERWTTTPLIIFETFRKEELYDLRRMYERKEDMKKYPNPFLYQPE